MSQYSLSRVTTVGLLSLAALLARDPQLDAKPIGKSTSNSAPDAAAIAAVQAAQQAAAQAGQRSKDALTRAANQIQAAKDAANAAARLYY